jgi:hypothetical protein
MLKGFKLPSRTFDKLNVLTDISLLNSREPDIDQFHKVITNRQPHKIQLPNESLYDYATKYLYR